MIYTYVQDCCPEAVSGPMAGLKVNSRRICKGRMNLGKVAEGVFALLRFPLATEARSTTSIYQESIQEILGVAELARALPARILTAASHPKPLVIVMSALLRT